MSKSTNPDDEAPKGLVDDSNYAWVTVTVFGSIIVWGILLWAIHAYVPLG